MTKKKKIILFSGAILLGILIFFGVYIKKAGKSGVIAQSIFAVDKIAQLLPIESDTKKELEALNKIVTEITKKDGVERRYFLMLQNNLELRPGGGFLGQYAVLTFKNGEVTSSFVEDANLLDQRITADINAPYPFEKMMSIKRWKFRDSNFSPDFPANAEKARYFYRLAGGKDGFSGVIAINASVLNHVIEITGPLTIPGYPGEYTKDNAVLKLEEQVEKGFSNQGIAVENRKLILKKMAQLILDKLKQPTMFAKVTEMGQRELKNKDIMLHFEDAELQAAVALAGWSGEVDQGWSGDYLMIVDANLGALKSNYFIKREMEYEVDLTGEVPTAYLRLKYTHTAQIGDWRTSDYHSYLRIYAPKGSKLLERKMVSYPNIQEELNHTSFGFIFHAIMGQETLAEIKYELPKEIKESYHLLVQKQSGVESIPLKIKIKTQNGEVVRENILDNSLKLELKQ
jgi:hypothetical protein